MQITGSSNAMFIKSYSAQSIAARDDGQGDISATNNATVNQSADKDQQRIIQNLKNRDREVRNHEQAHINAAGGLATSGANFSYTTGPDGKRYVTGGDVSIDTSPVPDDPEATMRKAETIRRAALAPAQPSGQDYSVAGKAQAMANKARVELLRSQLQSQTSGSRLDVSV